MNRKKVEIYEKLLFGNDGEILLIIKNKFIFYKLQKINIGYRINFE